MTTFARLTAAAAVFTTFAIPASHADAGSCHRRTPPSCSSHSPGPRPQAGGPRVGAPGAGAPGVAGPGAPGAPGAGGRGAGGPGAGQGQPGGAQTQQQTQQQTTQTQAVSVPAGATVTLPGNRGAQPGNVNLVINNVRLPLNIVNWSDTGVTVTLPAMQINSATSAELEIVVPGSDAQTIAIQLQPQAAVLVVR